MEGYDNSLEEQASRSLLLSNPHVLILSCFKNWQSYPGTGEFFQLSEVARVH